MKLNKAAIFSPSYPMDKAAAENVTTAHEFNGLQRDDDCFAVVQTKNCYRSVTVAKISRRPRSTDMLVEGAPKGSHVYVLCT